MPRVLYSFRMRAEVPLLTEEEYAPIRAALGNRIKAIMDYRRAHKCSLDEARQYSAPAAMDLYEGITGLRLEHPDQLYAVRLAEYGRPCPVCSRPLRTPRAKLCAECGHQLPPGEVAGSAEAFFLG